jgi:hypothetical protein
MPNRRRLIFILIAFFILLAGYRIPWVEERAAWRLLAAEAYVRGVLDPAGELPAPDVHINVQTLPSATPQPTVPGPTATPMPSPTPLPGSAHLTAPRYELQGPNNCGPATLSLYLNYYGWEGDQDVIAAEIKPISADRNVNVDELVYYAQNWAGWLNSQFRVGGDIELLKAFVAVGIPVMIEEGYLLESVYWPNDDQWAGHYLLVTGYDDAIREFTVQDTFEGGPDHQISYERLDEGWQQFNRVYMLVYLPHQEESVRSILGEHWDEDINRQAALEIAEAETITDPENAFTWFNVGMNLVHFDRYDAAADAFDVARSIGLPQRMLRYQFGPFFAYYNSNRLDDLDLLIDYALRITDVSEEAQIWKGWSLYRQGDSFGAIEEFRIAHEFNPKSVYVDQALAFFGANP